MTANSIVSGSRPHMAMEDPSHDTKAPTHHELASELRKSITSSLINAGVLAALLMALSGMIYVDPAPEPGKCFGEQMLQAEMVIVWMSMCFYFVATISSVVQLMDLDGVPNKLLIGHLRSGKTIYSIPQLSTTIGIFLTAIAYAIDIGERGGCAFFAFGILAAPCFVSAIVLLWYILWRRRQRLFQEEKYKVSHVALFTTWANRIPKDHDSKPAGNSSGMGEACDVDSNANWSWLG